MDSSLLKGGGSQAIAGQVATKLLPYLSMLAEHAVIVIWEELPLII